MTTAQTDGILTKLIYYKCDQNRKGNYDLTYKLNEEEVQDMQECFEAGQVPTEWAGIKLEMK